MKAKTKLHKWENGDYFFERIDPNDSSYTIKVNYLINGQHLNWQLYFDEENEIDYTIDIFECFINFIKSEEDGVRKFFVLEKYADQWMMCERTFDDVYVQLNSLSLELYKTENEDDDWKMSLDDFLDALKRLLKILKKVKKIWYKTW